MLFAVLIMTILLSAIQALRAKRLLASALWLAGASALLAIALFHLGAFQVAVIELSVGAGLVTVLLVFAISIAGEEPVRLRAIVPLPLALCLAGVVVGLLGWLVLPASPDPGAGTTVPAGGAFWQQRSLDMVVQVVLIFSGVLGLLGVLAEVRAPLEQAVAREVSDRREKELLAMERTGSPPAGE